MTSLTPHYLGELNITCAVISRNMTAQLAGLDLFGLWSVFSKSCAYTDRHSPIYLDFERYSKKKDAPYKTDEGATNLRDGVLVEKNLALLVDATY